MGDLSGLKSELRSVVVSSPTQVDVRSLNNDYRRLMGRAIPYLKYGYKDLVVFLKEQCSDCFVFTGPATNPYLTLILPDSLKHIDQFVQKQKSTSVNKFKGKRRSIPESAVKPTPPSPNHALQLPRPDLIFSTFKNKVPSCEAPKNTAAKASDINLQNKENLHNGNTKTNNDQVNKNAVKNFLKKRLPLYCSTPSVDEDPILDKDISSKEGSSGKQPSSSSSSTKQLQLDMMKSEIMEIISDAPDGVWCTDLIWLYRERFGRELNYTRLGYTSLISLVLALQARVRVSRPVDTGDWLLADAALGPPLRQSRQARQASLPRQPRQPRQAEPRDPDEALPGVDFDPDVFPADCVQYMESVPAAELDDFEPGACIKVIVGEVYSPSHFWLIRYGEGYSIAMEDMMDEMTQYYTAGAGRDRRLACGAVRVGQYCSSAFEGDWHRSIIVKILDSDTVKVRHIDYGTVEAVARGALKPLRRQWAGLRAQAARARLAGARPPAAGRRWPRAAAARFLRLVQDTRLFASVVSRDREESSVEVLLIDTSGATDASVTELLIRGGYADERRGPATGEAFLYPRFEALESGETPSYAEIQAYLRDGIALDYVEAYRRHVPVDLPPPEPEFEPEPEPESKPESATVSPSATFSPPCAPLACGVPPPRPQEGPWRWPARMARGGVTLSLAECEVYRVLCGVDPAAAQWYMSCALGRALRPPSLRPPPGF